MGYTTDFVGELRFTVELNVAELAKLREIISDEEAEIEIPHWKGGTTKDRMCIDLEFSKDFGGVRHTGIEKTYYFVEQINWVLDRMREVRPDFGLSGELKAQGEEFEDRWLLQIKDGRAIKVPLAIKGQRVKCPECDHKWVIEEPA